MNIKFDDKIKTLMMNNFQTYLLFIIKFLTENYLYEFKASFENVFNVNDIKNTIEVLIILLKKMNILLFFN
jgi:hypothetical protein